MVSLSKCSVLQVKKLKLKECECFDQNLKLLEVYGIAGATAQ